MSNMGAARPRGRAETGPEDEQPGGHTVAPIVRRAAGRRRELDRLAALMRSPGALAAVPVPPSLHQLARRRAEVTV